LEGLRADGGLLDDLRALDDTPGFYPLLDKLKGFEGVGKQVRAEFKGLVRGRGGADAGANGRPAPSSAGVPDDSILDRARRAGKGMGERFVALFDNGDK